MDFLNLQSMMYMAFRLSPFILVSYFVLTSIINSDMRGVIFLGLLLIEVVIAIMAGNMLGSLFGSSSQRSGMCDLMSLTEGGPMSKYLPLNLNVFAFTLGYLGRIVDENKSAMRNMPALILLSAVIVYHIYWLLINSCSNLLFVLLSTGIGGVLGAFFAYAVQKSKIADLSSGITNSEKCNRPSKTVYKCRTNAVME